jgi:hypothetical protein
VEKLPFIPLGGCTKYYKGPQRKITHRPLIYAEKTSLTNMKKRSSPSLSPPMSRRPAKSPSNSEAGTTPLASKPPMDATADLKGLRRRLKKRRTSPAWMTNGLDAVDVLLQRDASEELRHHLLITVSLRSPGSIASMTLGTEKKSKGARLEEAAQAYQIRDEELGPPSNPKNLPRTRGRRRR